MKKLIFVGLALIMLLCVGFLSACGENKDQKDVFKSFISGLNACYKDGFKDEDCENVALAFGVKDSNVYKSHLAILKGLKDDANKKDITIKLTIIGYSEWEVSGNSAQATIKVRVEETEKGKTKTDTEETKVKFKKVNDVWYIDVITFTFYD